MIGLYIFWAILAVVIVAALAAGKGTRQEEELEEIKAEEEWKRQQGR